MKREVFSSRAEKFFLSHKDGKENDGDDHRKERSLCNIEWVGFSQAGNKNGDTGNRGSRTTSGAGQESQRAETVDLHSEFLSVRCNGTVKGHGTCVAAAHQNGKDERSDGAAPLSNLLGLDHQSDEAFNQAGSS